MSDSTCIVLGVLVGLAVFGMIGLGAFALWLGRPIRAQGRALLDGKHEFAVAVEVPTGLRTVGRGARAEDCHE